MLHLNSVQNFLNYLKFRLSSMYSFILPLSTISEGKEKTNKSSKRVVREEAGKEVRRLPPLKPRDRELPSELSAHTVGDFLPGGGFSWAPKQWFSDCVHSTNWIALVSQAP